MTTCAPSATLAPTDLVRVRREGNLAREYGHVCPHLGKLAPVNAAALDAIATSAVACLPPERGSTLLIGLAEASLLLARWVHRRLPGAELCFTTRERLNRPDARRFLEPHSHGPTHALVLPNRPVWDRVVIVEDEMTTGTTVKNLILALDDRARAFSVLTLADLRTLAQRRSWNRELARRGVEVTLADLSKLARPGVEAGTVAAPDSAIGAVYGIGEGIVEALELWETLPGPERPSLRHVTRSPWVVDMEAVTTRIVLDVEGEESHFLYNWTRPDPARAIIVGHRSTARVAERLQDFLTVHGVLCSVVEVDP